MPLEPEPIYRTVIESDRFSRELHAVSSDNRRADEFVDNAKWLLARNPYAGHQLIPSHIWFLPIAERLGRAALYYRFDVVVVELLSIRQFG